MAKKKLEKFAEMDRFSHVIQADFDEVFKKDYKLKGKWATTFFNNNNPLILELGCGKGEYSVSLAKKFPNKNFIGADIKGYRMHKGASEAHELGLKNVAFIRTRIELIESFFAHDEVDEIWLTFPDPQMKRARRRLTATRFVNSYLNFLKPGGVVHLKTDSNFQYCYTQAMIEANGLTILRNFSDLYNSGFVDDVLSIQTYYETRFTAHGIPIKYISFLLDGQRPFVEPDVEIPFDTYRNSGQSVKFDQDEKE